LCWPGDKRGMRKARSRGGGSQVPVRC
jgi:hypothetical protein